MVISSQCPFQPAATHLVLSSQTLQKVETLSTETIYKLAQTRKIHLFLPSWPLPGLICLAYEVLIGGLGGGPGWLKLDTKIRTNYL